MTTEGPIVKLELKKLAIFPRMSEETTAFTADLWIGGEKVGHAKNHGHGGATMVNWTIPPTRWRAFEEVLKSRVPDRFAGFTSGAEWVVDEMVEAQRAAREIGRNDARLKRSSAKRGTAAARFDVPRESGKETIWVEYGKGDEATAKAQMHKKHPGLENWTAIA